MTVTKTPTSNHSDEYVVTFSDVAVADADVLADAQAKRVNQLALAATGAFAAGVVAGALRLTADYVANREQFGKPLSTFQTVAAQLAEVYIASRTMTLAATSVVWRLAEGRDADEDLDVLGYWLDVAGAAGDAALPPPARRYGYGHRLPDGPLLLDDQGPDPPPGRTVTPPRPGGSANVHRTDPRAATAASRTAAILFESHLRRRGRGDGERPARQGLPRGHQADGHATASSASAGPRSSAATASARSSSRSSSTRRTAPTCRCPR